MLAGSRQDAEDALQDVFLRAYGALRANERPVSLRAWLYRVAHNRCIDQLRRPVPQQADVFDVSRSPLHDPMDEAERREDLRRLVEDVRRLPEGQRSALLMREMEGLSYEELAAALETTVPAIKSLLVRARIGLVEAAEARDTACTEIRDQLLAAYDKGVRASGQARRHMRECDGCREYRSALRGVQRSFAGLAPAGPALGPLGLLAKLGIGGSSAGAGAGVAATGATSGGGVAGICVAGGGAAVTAGKVVAVVCSVAVVTAGAMPEVRQQVESAVHPGAAPAAVAPHAAKASAAAHRATAHAQPLSGVRADAAAAAASHRRAATQRLHAAAETEAVELAPIRSVPVDPEPAVDQTPLVAADPQVDPGVTGGAVAPDEPEATAGETTTTTAAAPSQTTPAGGRNPPPPPRPAPPGSQPAQQQPQQQPAPGSATAPQSTSSSGTNH